jgi:alginate O-acetyltransferase complex protein AlgJ
MKLIRYFFILVFISIVYFPLINNRFQLIRKTFEGTIPQPPKPDVKKLDGYPKRYEDYFDKRLEIKPWLVSLDSKFKIRTLSVSPNPSRVIIGSDGWLFLTERCIDEYSGANLFTSSEIGRLKKKFDARASFARKSSSSKFYFVIVPLKHTVYHEYLPLSIQKHSNYTRADQIVQCFKNDSMVKVIDLREELIAHKPDHILYYKTDNHWNDIGGYVGYRKIIDEVKKDFKAIRPADLSCFKMDSTIKLLGGEAMQINASELFPEACRYEYNPGPSCLAKEGTKRGYVPPSDFPYPWDYEMVRVTGDSSLPDALVIRDSFSDALLPFLAENFRRSVFIFDGWQYKALYDIVDTEKPGVVMYIVLESNFDSLLKFD